MTTPVVHRSSHHAMATTFGISIAGGDARYSGLAARAAFAELDRLESELSRFRPTSDIARINALPAGGMTRVGPDTMRCLWLAERFRRATRDAFDASLGSGRLELRPRAHVVRVRGRGVRIDLGAIGKGYALDRMAVVLADWDAGAALLHAGQSTVLATGVPPGTAGWHVGLRHPLRPTRVVRTLWLRDGALSGSGRRVHGNHIVNPRTGRAVTGCPAAWATAPTGAHADALSTAFMVMNRREIARACRGRIAGLVAHATGRRIGLASFGGWAGSAGAGAAGRPRAGSRRASGPACWGRRTQGGDDE